MIPCGKRFMVEAAVRGFRFAQLPGYLDIFPAGKLGRGRPAVQQPLQLRGDWRWGCNLLFGSAEAGGLHSSSPYSYAVTGGGCKLPRYREGVAKLRFCHQCRDIALRCGLVTKELCKRTKGTSLHLGSSAIPST